MPATKAPTNPNTAAPPRSLRDLAGIGPAMSRDLQSLGIESVMELAGRDGDDLYRRLCEMTGTRQDPCVLDTLRCAVAQAKDPNLPRDQANWWWWSRMRKRGDLPGC